LQQSFVQPACGDPASCIVPKTIKETPLIFFIELETAPPVSDLPELSLQDIMNSEIKSTRKGFIYFLIKKRKINETGYVSSVPNLQS
jgi:hypothetical protein